MKTTSSPSLLLRHALTGFLLWGVTACHASNDVVTDWNLAMTVGCDTDATDGRPVAERVRAWAVAHLAMLDAIRATSPTTNRPRVAGDTSAAAAVAAHDVLVALLPEYTDTWQAQLRAHLATLPDDTMTTHGKNLGAASAARALHDATATGDAPLLLRRAGQFPAEPPFSLDRMRVAPTFRDRREFHGLHERHRAGAVFACGPFWSGAPELIWNRVARALAEQNSLDLPDRARLFAALNVALADAGLSASEARRLFATSRKVPLPENRTTIYGLPDQRTGGAGIEVACYVRVMPSDEVIANTVVVPAVPNYPSITAAKAGAASAVLRAHFKDSPLPFPLAAPDAPADGPPFSDLMAAAREAALASVFAGDEFIEAAIAGYDQGIAVGRWITGRRCFRTDR